MSSLADVVTPSELQQLLDILSNGHLTVQQSEAAFKSAFKEDQYIKVTYGLSFLRKDAGMFGCVGSQIETVQSLILLDVMRRSSNTSQDTQRCVKASLYDALCTLEQHLREDARRAESTKYRSTTKESAASATSRKSAKDIVDAETMRIHTAMKWVAFQCLVGKLDSTATSLSLIAQEQAALDAALDAWSRNSGEIKEVVNSLAHAAETESEKCSVGTLSRLGAVLYQPSLSSSAVYVPPTVARPTIPQPATQMSDLRYVLHSQSAALSQQLMFDPQWHSADWRAAKDMVRAASVGPLSASEAEAVHVLTAATVPRLGITAPLICGVAAHNPEIAAAVLNKLKDPSALLEAILSSPAPADHLETVLLHCVQSVQHIHVFKYVASSLARIRMCSSSTDGVASSSGDAKELVVNLVHTLHQLITKFSKDNKELYINSSHKSELAKLFESYSHVPEVASRWADLK